MGQCKWCNGRGYYTIEGCRSYPCGDCNGRGWLPECDYCDEEYTGEYCPKCYTDCKCCGRTTRLEEDWEGLCEDCFYELDDLRNNCKDDTVVCRRCGSPVITSITPEYVYYCPEHDEDLYLFETCYLSIYKKEKKLEKMEKQEKINNILGYLWSLYCDDNMKEGRKVLVNTDSLLEDHINGMNPKQAFVAGTKAAYRPDDAFVVDDSSGIRSSNNIEDLIDLDELYDWIRNDLSR